MNHLEETFLYCKNRLLFIAHYFPPMRAISSIRAWNIAKYLARKGWNITVVTPNSLYWRHIDNPMEVEQTLNENRIYRIQTGYRWRCLMPQDLVCWNRGIGWFVGGLCRRIRRCIGVDSAIGWLKPADKACKHLREGDFDVIVATGGPFIAFRLAERLSRRLRCPYVLDYRDPWTGNPSVRQPSYKKREETRLLKKCSAVTIVSHTWAREMANRFDVESKLYVVPNGYDPEEMARIDPYNFGHAAIVYAGNFYPPNRTITPVMASLKILEEIGGIGKEWCFHYYGSGGKHVLEEAKRFGVTKRVVIHGETPRSEVLSAIRGAHVSVVITSVAEQADGAERGWVPGKLYEPLGLGTPVLLVAPLGSDARGIVEKTGIKGAFTANQTREIALFLRKMVGNKKIETHIPEEFSWHHLSLKFDYILKETIRNWIISRMY